MSTPPSPPSALLAVNVPDLLARVGHDRVFLSELVAIFKQEYPRLLQSLQESVVLGNLPSVEKVSHTLIGMLSALSLERAAATAARIGQIARAGETSWLAEQLKRLESEVAELLPALDACTADPSL